MAPKIETTEKLAARCLGHWAVVTSTVGKLSETQLKELIKWELTNKARQPVLVRLHQRYSMLRAKRERQLLAKETLPW